MSIINYATTVTIKWTVNAAFVRGKLISTIKYFTYITVTKTTNIVAGISLNIFVNLERASLSLIVFGFQKAALGGDGRAL